MEIYVKESVKKPIKIEEIKDTGKDLVRVVRALEKNVNQPKELLKPLIDSYYSKVNEIDNYLRYIEDSECYQKAATQFQRLRGRGKRAIGENKKYYFII